MYVIALLGNFTIPYIVMTEPRLHEPMYYFLCMLAATDLVLVTSILPKTLSIFWFNSREIEFNACLIQMFFIKSFFMTESGLFVAMAQRPYCKTNIIPHTHCEHTAVLNLACADVHIGNYYGLFVVFFVTGLDVVFIILSYFQILRTIFKLPTKDARLKTFGTCGTHLGAILAFYIPRLFSSLASRFGENMPLYFHILSANMYLLLPPTLNPIIYGVKIKQIRDRLFHLVTHCGGNVFSWCCGSQAELKADRVPGPLP
ncbi:olfactory receptor 52E4-like [Pelodiscus sinensis]|uniref:olfactory receptor 52E4-like n=1 Tax=Pelodiscus sinensis TaxID=13735 RepID=UPI003F6BCA6C